MHRTVLPARQSPVAAMTADKDAADAMDDEEAELDALVRAEVEACFAGLEEALATGDEKAALAVIQTQGKQVLSNVLTQMEDDGKLLSSTLAARVEEIATEERTEMLKRYDAQCVAMNAAFVPRPRRLLFASHSLLLTPQRRTAVFY